jgi:signal transduction histidine kinase/ActR/RegA family two-component response regulator
VEDRPQQDAPGQHRTIRFYAATAIVVWTMVALGSFLAYARHVRAGVDALAAAHARAAFQKDLAYRRWVVERGGVYVPADERTPPNPYLSVPERDITTPSGRRLTLVNPAYMVRQVLDRERRRGGASSWISSNHPHRPENAARGWDAGALERLAAGEAEVVQEAAGEDGAPPVLRFMGPLVATEKCVGCHPDVRPGDLRGGIAVEVPMAEYLAVGDAQIGAVGWGHAVVWALGAIGITLAAGRASRRVSERERDREAREQLEEELAHARRLEALGRLAGGVAHDLNNLLSPILGNASLALERAPAGELREDLEDIRDAAQRARGLTQQLLAFGRKQVLSLEPLDPSECVEAVLPMIRRLVGDAVEVEAALASALPAVRADRAQLGAALLNLAANARDAMPGGGALRLATALEEVDAGRAARLALAPGPHVAITVSDTGQGIDEATRARLFEPFFTTKGAAGNGLGLASAHGTIRQLGGAVEVESTPGRGATFTVLLPAVSDRAVALSAPGPERAAPRGSETVLLAEDDPAVRRYVAAALGGLGYRVLAAGCGEEALVVARGHAGPIHALVSDLRMPRLGGPELCARLRAERPDLATVFITGYAGDALSPGNVAPGGAPVVAKPFTPTDIAVALRAVLDARSA